MTTPNRHAVDPPAPWLPRAACHDHPELPPDTWMPRTLRDPGIPAAVATCLTCPELARCRAWAEEHQPTAGIWGGHVWGTG